jgi:hypothetical protein
LGDEIIPECVVTKNKIFPQRNQLKIIQDQQKQQEKQQGRKVTTSASPVAARSIGVSTTTATPYVEEKGEESVIEYDYYYYDYDDSLEHGNFYANDDYDPKAPGRIIDPTNARPPLLPIVPPSTSVAKTTTTPLETTNKSHKL